MHPRYETRPDDEEHQHLSLSFRAFRLALRSFQASHQSLNFTFNACHIVVVLSRPSRHLGFMKQALCMTAAMIDEGAFETMK